MRVTKKKLRYLIREVLNQQQIQKLTNLLVDDDNANFKMGVGLLRSISEYEEEYTYDTETETGEQVLKGTQSIPKDVHGLTALENAVSYYKDKLSGIEKERKALSGKESSINSEIEIGMTLSNMAPVHIKPTTIGGYVEKAFKGGMKSKFEWDQEIHKLTLEKTRIQDQQRANRNNEFKIKGRLNQLLSLGVHDYYGKDPLDIDLSWYDQPLGGMKFGSKDSYVNLDDPLMERKK